LFTKTWTKYQGNWATLPPPKKKSTMHSMRMLMRRPCVALAL
jgi:hypothetical protein